MPPTRSTKLRVVGPSPSKAASSSSSSTSKSHHSKPDPSFATSLPRHHSTASSSKSSKSSLSRVLTENLSQTSTATTASSTGLIIDNVEKLSRAQRDQLDRLFDTRGPSLKSITRHEREGICDVLSITKTCLKKWWIRRHWHDRKEENSKPSPASASTSRPSTSVAVIASEVPLPTASPHAQPDLPKPSVSTSSPVNSSPPKVVRTKEDIQQLLMSMEENVAAQEKQAREVRRYKQAYRLLKASINEQEDIIFFSTQLVVSGSWSRDSTDVLVYFKPSTTSLCICISISEASLWPPTVLYRVSIPLHSLLSLKYFHDISRGIATLLLTRDLSDRPPSFAWSSNTNSAWHPLAQDFTFGHQFIMSDTTVLLFTHSPEALMRLAAILNDFGPKRLWVGAWVPGWSPDDLLNMDRKGPSKTLWGNGEVVEFSYAHPRDDTPEHVRLSRWWQQVGAPDASKPNHDSTVTPRLATETWFFDPSCYDLSASYELPQHPLVVNHLSAPLVAPSPVEGAQHDMPHRKPNSLFAGLARTFSPDLPDSLLDPINTEGKDMQDKEGGLGEWEEAGDRAGSPTPSITFSDSSRESSLGPSSPPPQPQETLIPTFFGLPSSSSSLEADPGQHEYPQASSLYEERMQFMAAAATGGMSSPRKEDGVLPPDMVEGDFSDFTVFENLSSFE